MLSVAAIDLGSNAIRLVAVRIGSNGFVERIQNERYAVRIGSEVFSTGKISPALNAQLLDVFADCASRLREFGVDRYRAVATSAMREAANSRQVIAAIRKRTGIDIEIISGAEEGGLMRHTLTRALGSVPKDALFIDLGGGSLELERASGLRGRSLPLGTVRLLQRFPSLSAPVNPQMLVEIREALERDLGRFLGRIKPAEFAIGTGGNLDALARLAPASDVAVAAIDLSALEALSHKLGRMSPNERARRFHLRHDRADVILPATLVILALAKKFQLTRLIVPGTGIRESILHRLVDEMCKASPELGASPVRKQRRRTQIAHELFSKLAALHQMWPVGLRLLDAASLSCDAGTSRDPRARLEQVRSSFERWDGPLLADPEAQRVACYAAALAVSDGRPRPHPTLSAADRAAARTIAAILRLAGGLSECTSARSLKVSLLRDPIEISTELACKPPRAAIAPLERVLGRKIVIRKSG